MTTAAGTTKLPPIAERALADAGIVLAVIRNPGLGQDATFEYANEALVDFMGPSVGALQGNRVAVLMSRIADIFARQKLLDSMVKAEPGKIDIPVTIAGAERWLGVTITFPPREDAAARMTMIGKDITAAMTSLSREQKSKLLLTSMFTQMDSAIALITGSGHIVMANAAFQQLVRSPADATNGMMLDDFVAPEHAAAERAAVERQTTDGRAYRHGVTLLTRDGDRVDVTLGSTPLAFERRQYRLVTLTPTQNRPGLGAEFEASLATGRGDVRPVSIAAIRQSIGAGWERVSIKVMIAAERIIRQRLRSNDLVTRIDDETFAVWFNERSKAANDDAVAVIVRDLRLRLMTQFAADIETEPSARRTATQQLADA